MSKTVQSYLMFLSNCQTLEELWDGHTEKMAEYGFDRLIYGFTRDRTASPRGDPEEFVIMTKHRKE